MAGQWEDVPQDSGWQDVSPTQATPQVQPQDNPAKPEWQKKIEPYLKDYYKTVAGVGSNILEGLTFGSGDELTSKIGQLSGISNPMSEMITGNTLQDQSRIQREQFQKNNPWTARGLEFGGNMAGSAAMLAALPEAVTGAIGSLPLWGQGTIYGGLFGGLSGAGHSEEGQKTLGTGIGALTGGVLGGLTAPLIPMAVNAINKGIVTPASRALDYLKGIVNPSEASQAVSEAPLNMSKASQKAVLQALEDSGLSIQAAKQKLANMSPQVSSQTVLADLGDPLAQTAQFAASNSMAARQQFKNVLEQRAKDSLSTITEPALKKLVGTDANAIMAAKSVYQAGKQAAAPLYSQVDSAMVPIDENVMSVMSKPLAQTAFKRAIIMMRNDPNIPAGTAIPTLEDLQLGGQVPLRALDYVNRTLNDISGKAIRAGENNSARIATGLGNQLTDHLDSQFPFYAQARQTIGDAKSFQDAIKLGQTILKSDAVGLSDELAGLNATDKKGAMIGAYQAIRDKLAGTGITGNEANKLSSTLIRERLGNAAKNPKDLQEFTSVLDDVSNMFNTKNVIIGGSPTTPRAIMDNIISQHMPVQTSGATVKSLPGRAIDKIIRAYSAKDINQTEQFSNDIAAMLSAKGPKEILPVLNSLLKYQSKMTPEMRNQLSRALAAGLQSKSGQTASELITKGNQ